MKKQIENYLKKGLKEINDRDIVHSNKIGKVYFGYIASFGPAVIHSGLLPAIAFYEAETSHAEGDRKKITTMILNIISEKHANNATLLDYCIQHQSDPLLKQNILDASIALKLAMRTFAKEEKE